jgi:hypothetical protein
LDVKCRFFLKDVLRLKKSIVFFINISMQELKKSQFMFKYSGPVFDQYTKRELDIKRIEGFIDPADSYVNVIIYTSSRHRPSELKNMITRYNDDLHHAPHLKIKLRKQSEYEEEIMTLSGCRSPKNHPFYLRILQNMHSPTYFIWPLPLQNQVSNDLSPLDSSTGIISHQNGGDGEFDVVKKRRLMTTESTSPFGDETSSEALAQFEEFEANVLPALFKIDNDDKHFRKCELLQMEQDLYNGAKPTMGGVYVAVSKAVKYPKIGATRRGHPSSRLQELSRYVPSPFSAVFWVPSMLPFKTEAAIHRHFDPFRIREKGACTEFFNVDISVVGDYLRANYDIQERDAIGNGVC